MLELTTTALLEKLEETDEYKNVRSEILHELLELNEDEHDLASHILDETSEKYFYLGFKSCCSLITEFIINK